MNEFITTRSGRHFYFENPQSEQIHIEDIAHALSMLCRWNGQCREFFSVAQHSVLVSHLVNQNDMTLMRWGLLHDAAEAYMGDMTQPLKRLFPEYKILEERVLHVIANKFNLVWPIPSELKEFDTQMLKTEAVLYMPHTAPECTMDIPQGTKLIGAFTASWHQENAKGMFLRRYDSLFR